MFVNEQIHLEPISKEILSDSSAWDASFVSDIYGYIGQIQIVKGNTELIWLYSICSSLLDGFHWLIFIKNQEMVCVIQNGHEIYRVTDILVQPFDNIDEVHLSSIYIALTRQIFI